MATKLVGDDEVYGPRVKVATDEEVYGTPPKQKSAMDYLKQYGGDFLKAAPAAVDMVIGAPLSLGAALGGTIRKEIGTRFLGETVPQAEAEATRAKDFGGYGTVKTPLQSALKTIAGIEPLNLDAIGTAFQKGSEKVSTATGGTLTPWDVANNAEILLNTLGFAVPKPVVKAVKDAVIKPTRPAPGQGWREARRTYEVPDEPAAVPPDTGFVGPEAPKGTPASMKTPAGYTRAEMPAEGAYNRADVNVSAVPEPPTAVDLAKANKARRKEIVETFRNDPETADYLRALADERMEARSWQLRELADRLGRNVDEAEWQTLTTDPKAMADAAGDALAREAELTGLTTASPDFPDLAARAQAAAAKPGFTRTAEELIDMREFAKRSMADRFQAGRLDPELRNGMIMMGLGLTVPVPLMLHLVEYFSPGRGKQASENVKKSIADFFKLPQKQPQTEAAPPVPTDEGPVNFPDKIRNPGMPGFEPQKLITDAGAAAAGAAAAAWVKKGGGVFEPRLKATLLKPFERVVDLSAAVDAIPGFNDMPASQKIEVATQLLKENTSHLDRTVQTYINKYLGTENDPLKDVVVPVTSHDGGQAVVTPTRWEELTDVALQKGPAPAVTQVGNLHIRPSFNEVRPGEPVWGFQSRYGDIDVRPGANYARADTTVTPSTGADRSGGNYKAVAALESYLDKVAKFWAQLPTELRNKYDFPTLVKKYAENVEREASSAKSIVDWQTRNRKEVFNSPQVVKEYPAVELPERKVIINDPIAETRIRGKEVALPAGRTQFKWIRLAKQGEFFDEGQRMGHSVGGYEVPEGQPGWTPRAGGAKYNTYASPNYGVGGSEAIKSGKAEVYSLRDSNGISYATIEVERITSPRTNGTAYHIKQIKGVKNSDVPEVARPYVRDFITDPRWEVANDLNRLGLDWQDYSNAVQARAGEPTSFPVRKLSEFERGGPNRQSGKISPELAIALGGAAVGWFAGKAMEQELPVGMAALGAAVPFAARALWKNGGVTAASAMDALNIYSTEMGKIGGPALRKYVRDFELKVHQGQNAARDMILPFVQQLKANTTPEIDSALRSGDAAAFRKAAAGRPTLLAAFEPVQRMIKDFEGELKALGRFGEGLTNYFPRVVKDFEGLKAALGQEVSVGIEKLLKEADTEMLRKRGRTLTDIEQSIVIDRYLSAKDGAQINAPGFAKKRSVKMTKELEQFYETPADALAKYALAAVQDVELAKFFGKDVRTTTAGGRKFTNVDASIGEFVQQRLKAGELTPEQAVRMRQLLKDRFSGGEQTPHWLIQDFRNVNNIALLGNFKSAVTQLGDVALSAYHHSMLPTLQALKEITTGDARVSPRDFGLVNHTLEEFSSGRLSGKAVQKVFGLSGFNLIDQLGKKTLLNASLIKNQKLVRTPEGLAALKEKWGDAFPGQFDALVGELKSGKVGPQTQSLLWSELSDAQPISKSEVPVLYLRHPNGRVLYQMKTYTTKQLDVIRRDIVQEMAKGKYVPAAKKAMVMATVLGVSGVPIAAIKEWVSGRSFDLEDDVDLIGSIMQGVGVNRYMIDQMKKGEVISSVGGTLIPPWRHYDTILKGKQEAARYIPGVGPTINDLLLGGNEKVERRKELEKKRANETPEEQEARRLRSERARAKREGRTQ